MDSEFDFTGVEMEGRYQISSLRSWKVCGFELTRTWIPAQHPEDAPEGSITRFRPNREVNNPIPIFQSSLEHRLWWKNNPVTCLWLRSSPKESDNDVSFPSVTSCLQGPLGKELELWPQKGPITVWRTQSDRTVQTQWRKTQANPKPWLSAAASPVIPAIPAMNHQAHRKILRCRTHPYFCFGKYLLKSWPPSLCLLIVLPPRSIHIN